MNSRETSPDAISPGKDRDKELHPNEKQILSNEGDSDFSFEEWLEKQWHSSSTEMEGEVQVRILDTIKSKFLLEEESRVPKGRTGIRPIYMGIARYAAILFLMCLTGVGVYLYLSEGKIPGDLIVTVNKGQKTNITLSDGSVVWVNYESKLSYGSRFNAKERVVKLEGEAYFDIAHDKSRPFIVEANGMRIKVHGTKFNVNTRREKMSVSLLSGSVSLQYKNKESLMKPGEIAYCSTKTDSMEIKEKEIRLATLWTQDHVQFKKQPFKEIAPVLSEWYGIEIVSDPSLSDHEAYTFTLRNETIEEVLKIMSMINPITYKYERKDRIRVFPQKNRKK